VLHLMIQRSMINPFQIKERLWTIMGMYHEDLIKRSFRECLGDICCYGTVKHNDLGSEMGAEKRDERKMFGCRHGMKGVGFGAETAAKKGVFGR
nr:hypothetical protein [Tanacetum cinerariifolium]